MRKIFFVIGLLAVLAADGAAIHDIIKGETDVRGEWGALAISVVIIVLIVYRLRLND
ncbi:MAG: lipoprotein [Candidatus Krumholzibacteria bacterium]